MQTAGVGKLGAEDQNQGVDTSGKNSFCSPEDNISQWLASDTNSCSMVAQKDSESDQSTEHDSSLSSEELVENVAPTIPIFAFDDGGNHLVGKKVLHCESRDVLFPAMQKMGLPSAPVCRHSLRIGSCVFDACIDSGATFSLMSSKTYEMVKEVLGPLKEAPVTLSGASGNGIVIDGYVVVDFYLDDAKHRYPMLVGGLHGVDILLGLDWLMAVGAIVDYTRMVATLGRQQSIQLRTSPMEKPAMGEDFIKVHETTVLFARHTTRVQCEVTGSWEKEGPGIFEGSVKIANGVELLTCVVQPNISNSRLVVGIVNETTEDVTLEAGILLGKLYPVAEQEASMQQQKTDSTNYYVWQVANNVATKDNCHLANKRVQARYVDRDLLLEGSEDVPWQGLPHNVALFKQAGLASHVEMGKNQLISETPVDSPSFSSELALDASQMFEVCAGGNTSMSISQEESILSQEHSFEGLEKKERWDDYLLVNEMSNPVEPNLMLNEVAELSEPVDNSALERLPLHLRCMLPPKGILTEKELSQVIDLILDYQDIFVGPDGKVGFTNKAAHNIVLTEKTPIKAPLRRKSQFEKEHIAKEIDKMLEDGQIRPSKSPWGSPVVLVKKKDGTLRFCIDFRKLNDVTKKDAYPLPRIEECLDSLNGCRYFNTMDLASGYWQVAMDPVDREKTAFLTHKGLFEWNVMPFGLCNAPATFSRLMEQVLADICWSKCLVYLDDIISFGVTFAETLMNLEAVFRRLRGANLKLKPKKCELFRESVEYLGHVVCRDGLKPSRKKVGTLHDWVAPEDIGGVRRFLGFTGFYRRFVENYSQKAVSLTRDRKSTRLNSSHT